MSSRRRRATGAAATRCAMPERGDNDERAPVEQDEDEDTSTSSFPLPRRRVLDRLPTELEACHDDFAGMGDSEEEATVRLLPKGVVAAGGPRTEVDPVRAFADDDVDDTEASELAVSLPDDGGEPAT